MDYFELLAQCDERPVPFEKFKEIGWTLKTFAEYNSLIDAMRSAELLYLETGNHSFGNEKKYEGGNPLKANPDQMAAAETLFKWSAERLIKWLSKFADTQKISNFTDPETRFLMRNEYFIYNDAFPFDKSFPGADDILPILRLVYTNQKYYRFTVEASIELSIRHSFCGIPTLYDKYDPGVIDDEERCNILRSLRKNKITIGDIKKEISGLKRRETSIRQPNITFKPDDFQSVAEWCFHAWSYIKVYRSLEDMIYELECIIDEYEEESNAVHPPKTAAEKVADRERWNKLHPYQGGKVSPR